MPDLRTIRDVELMKVGQFDISNIDGWIVTPDMLRSAVDFANTGQLRKPVIKLGHVDPRFDGDPALGFVDNLRIIDNGATLIGDYVGVPASFAEVAAHAYPDRSIEGWESYVDSTGHTWPFILTALALLGATGPGIHSLRSLQDVTSLYGVAATLRTVPVGSFSNRTSHRARTLAVAAARRTRNQRILKG